ncbi:MAG: V-type ATP synthase subunit I [Treponema sp.]|nr:V-type ATP synthase subunit I [Treponema sp.]
MKKVSLVVQDRYRKQALDGLREVGVMHIQVSGEPSERLGKLDERIRRIENASALIKPLKAPQAKPSAGKGERRISDRAGNEEQEPYSALAVNSPERPDLAELILGLGESRLRLQEKLSGLELERRRIADWGDFDPADIAFLAERGTELFLYELGPDAFRNIPEEIDRIVLRQDKAAVRVAVLREKLSEPAPFRLPETRLSELDARITETAAELSELEARLAGFADRRPALGALMSGARGELEYERANIELRQVEDVPEELGIAFLTGYVPASDLGGVKALAAEKGWALASCDPGPEDAPPTKLKNNAVTGLVSPLTGFLELLPGYNERDASGWFLLFVTIFFGIILGDAAYGMVFLLIALLGIFKTARTGVPTALRMLLLFSVGNIAWGTVTATWFAVDHAKLPEFLISLSLPQLSTAKGTSQATVNENLQVFCFSLALLHLGIARIEGFFIGLSRRQPKCLADLGSLGMLLGMYNVILMLVVNPTRFPMQQFSLYALAGGFALSFLFSYYERNPVQAILGSLKNIFPVVLGVTGIFSDIMSYIRLWAVGLAGTALAGAFNLMAGPMLGNFLIFAGILVLVAGHGLNIALNSLSVLVHGVRLNILEFSGHAKLTWSGIPYRPFGGTGK